MAIEQFGRTHHERHVEPVGAQVHDRIAGCTLHHLDCNAGVFPAVSCQQSVKQAAGDQAMDTYA